VKKSKNRTLKKNTTNHDGDSHTSWQHLEQFVAVCIRAATTSETIKTKHIFCVPSTRAAVYRVLLAPKNNFKQIKKKKFPCRLALLAAFLEILGRFQRLMCVYVCVVCTVWE